MKALVFVAFFGLIFIAFHEDNQIDLLRDRIYDLERATRAPVEVRGQRPAGNNNGAQSRPQPETHDERVERAHREVAQRRREYCDNHPNLTVRIGCE